MRSHNLSRNANQSANFTRCQFTNFVSRRNIREGDITFFFFFQSCAILNEISNRLTQERIHTVILFDDCCSEILILNFYIFETNLQSAAIG